MVHTHRVTDPVPRRRHGLHIPGALGLGRDLGNGIESVTTKVSTLPGGARLEAVWVTARLEGDAKPTIVDDPELVLAGPLPPSTSTAPTPGARANFAWDGATFVVQTRFPVGTNYYGTGERAGRLERTGLRAVCWNTDAYAYDDYTPALYQSQPAVLAVQPDGRATFVVACTPRRAAIMIGTDGFEISVAGAPCVVVHIEAADPAAAVSGLSALIGRPAPVPVWALGYHQCRWSYGTEDEVRALVAAFDERELPLAAVWLDIDYMVKFRVFTWDEAKFPDLPGFVDALADQGLRTVAILDPGLAVDAENEVAQAARADDHLIVDSSGRPVEGRVWPGRCWFPDFTRAETQRWWAARVRRFVESTHLAGLWCDMNEPAVFSTPTQTLPEDAVHRGLGGGTHARFHNLYGQLMVEATRAGLQAARPDETPFVLTRAAHLSTPRHGRDLDGRQREHLGRPQVERHDGARSRNRGAGDGRPGCWRLFG